MSHVKDIFQVLFEEEPKHTYNLKGIHHRVVEKINFYSRIGRGHTDNLNQHSESTRGVQDVVFYQKPPTIPDDHFFNYIHNEIIPTYGHVEKGNHHMQFTGTHPETLAAFHRDTGAPILDDTGMIHWSKDTAFGLVGQHEFHPDKSMYGHVIEHRIAPEYIIGKKPNYDI